MPLCLAFYMVFIDVKVTNIWQLTIHIRRLLAWSVRHNQFSQMACDMCAATMHLRLKLMGSAILTSEEIRQMTLCTLLNFAKLTKRFK